MCLPPPPIHITVHLAICLARMSLWLVCTITFSVCSLALHPLHAGCAPSLLSSVYLAVCASPFASLWTMRGRWDDAGNCCACACACRFEPLAPSSYIPLPPGNAGCAFPSARTPRRYEFPWLPSKVCPIVCLGLHSPQSRHSENVLVDLDTPADLIVSVQLVDAVLGTGWRQCGRVWS